MKLVSYICPVFNPLYSQLVTVFCHLLENWSQVNGLLSFLNMLMLQAELPNVVSLKT